MSLSQTSGLTNKEMDRLREEYAKMQLQKAVLAQQQTAYTTNNTGSVTLNTLGAYTTIANPYAQQTPIPISIPEEKLDEGAWDVPISQLVDLWIVRYGSKWVNNDELDEFYMVAARRLRALNKLENHYVNGMDVHRIVE